MKDLLALLVDGEGLSVEAAIAGFEQIMAGQAEPAQTGAFLALMAQRGPTVDEVVAAATVMRQHMIRVDVPDGLTVVDTCGVGGTASRFFNISTAAAIVAAAAGHPRGLAVAKHGNRSVTSRSGSSNAFELLGVNLQASPEVLTRCLAEVGLCFCFAPAHHPAMKHAGPVRAALGFRTVFNLIGPLTNPAGATRQLLGVPSKATAHLIADALLQLGTERAMVVHSILPDGHPLGELTTFGSASVLELDGGRVKGYPIDPAALGLPFAVPDSVGIDSPQDSAKLIQRVLDNKPGPARDITVLNAAAALYVGGAANSLEEGLDLASDAISRGGAARTLSRLVELTSS